MSFQRLEKAMGWYTAQCKMLLFCVKTVVKVSHNFDLACLKNKKKRKKEKHFGHLVTFWFGTFAMLFRATGHVFCHENTQNEQYVVIKAFKFTVFESFKDFFCIYCISALSLHLESTDNMVQTVFMMITLLYRVSVSS